MHARLLCCPLPQNNLNSFRFFNKDTNQTVSHQGRRSFFAQQGGRGMPASSGRGICRCVRRVHKRGVRPTGRNGDAHASRAGISPARRADKKEKTCGFPFLRVISFPSGAPRARFIVVPPSGCRPAAVATGMGWLPSQKTYPHNCGKTSGLDSPFLLIKGSWAAETWAGGPLCASARPDLRQQMPQIFGQTLNCLLPLRRKRDDSQEGRKLGFSPLREPQRAFMRATARRAALSES